jgi:hypothetical protein
MRENTCKWPSVRNLARFVPETALSTHPHAHPELQSLLTSPTMLALEKLDGSNFGKTDTGVVVSRNLVVTLDAFQHVPVSVLPSLEQVIELKMAIEQCADCVLPPLTVYGELLHQNIYTYKARELGNWRAFGVVLDVTDMSVLQIDVLESVLAAAGLWVQNEHTRGAMVLVASPLLLQLLKAVDIPTVPVIASGTFESVSQQIQPLLMDNLSMEGFILTSPRFIFKWKNARRCAGNYLWRIEEALAAPCDLGRATLELLHMITLVSPDSYARPATVNSKYQGVYLDAVLTEALQSAESKFDAIDVWLKSATGAKEIAALLRTELFADLEATTKAERTCIGSAVAKRIEAVKRSTE